MAGRVGRIASTIGQLLGFSALALGSAVAHLPTAHGRAAIVGLARPYLHLVPGTLELGEITALGLDRLEIRGIGWRDAAGRPMVEGATLSVRSLSKLLGNVTRGAPLPGVSLHIRRLYAFVPTLPPRPEPTGPEPPPSQLRVLAPRIHLHIDEVVSRLDGLDGEARDVDLVANAIYVPEGLDVGIDRFVARINARPVGVEDLHLQGRFRQLSPQRVEAHLGVTGESLTCQVDAESDGQSRLRAVVERCRVPAGALDRVLRRPAAQSLPGPVEISHAELEGPLRGPWSLNASLDVAAQRLDLHAQLSHDVQIVELVPHAVSLRAVGAWLPDVELGGQLRAERHVEGETQRFVLDASALSGRFEAYPLPPIRAAGTLRGRHVELTELSAEGLGLRARARGDLNGEDTNFSAALDLDSPELSTLPWSQGRLGGRVSLHAEGERVDGVLRAEVNADLTNFRALAYRVDGARVRASTRGRDPLENLSASAAIRGLHAPQLRGGLDAQLNASGDARGSMLVRAHVSGQGLVALLPPLPAPTHATHDAHGPTALDLVAVADRSDPSRVRVTLRSAALQLRGARAELQGAVAVAQGEGAPRGVRAVRGAISFRTPEHGGLSANVANGRVSADFDRFNAAWLLPVLGDRGFGGTLSGHADIDLERPTATALDVTLHEGHFDRLRDVEARLSVGREPGGAMRVGLEASTPRGFEGGDRNTQIRLGLTAQPPRQPGDVAGWFAGIERLELALQNLNLGAFGDFLPPGLLAQGTAQATANFSRPRPDADLAGFAAIDVQNATAGLDVGLLGNHRMMPATVPMHLRTVLCTRLQSLDLSQLPLSLGVAIGAQRADETQPLARDCDHLDTLLTHPLAALSGSLRGPWQGALRALVTEAQAGRREPTVPTQSLLRATDLDLTVALGPVRRADWPLRTLPVRGPNGQLQTLRPPNVPDDTEVEATFRSSGDLLSLATEVDLRASVPPLVNVGFEEPVEAMVHGRVAPVEGASLMGQIGVSLNLMGTISPQAAREAQGRIEADVQVRGVLSELKRRGLDALDIRRFDIDTDNIRLERVAWAQRRGLRGTLNLDASASDNPDERLNLQVTVDGLQSRTVDDTGRVRATPMLNAVTRLVLQHQAQRWSSRGCVLAALGREPLRCDPRRDERPQTGALGVQLGLPLIERQGEGLAGLRPDVPHAEASIAAEDFDLSTLSAFIPEDVASHLGGIIDASLRWRGETPELVDGQITLRDGRVTLPSIGEPIRNMALTLQSRGREVTFREGNLAMGRGTMRFEGDATLGGSANLLARLNLRGTADDLAIISRANTWGWLDGTIGLSMNVRRDGASGALNLTGARLLVQEQPARDLQSLGDDPDIFVAGRTVLAAPRAGGAYPIELTYELPTPVWLRRSDFAVAATGAGSVHSDRVGSAISGTIELASTQCWFSIFGKRFDFERMRVVFDGNVNFNPELDIAAHYDSPTAGRIFLTVSGRFSAPNVIFRAEQAPTASQAEILAMIVVGRRSSQTSNGQSDLASQATAAIGSLITGLTLGVFTSSLSREFSFLPTLIVEPGSSGARGRYGAGINLSPRVYLQATYGAAAAGVGQTAATVAEEFRVLLEYAISETFTGSATWGTPSNRWGVDVFWSP